MENLSEMPTSLNSSILFDPDSIPQNPVTRRLLKELAQFVDNSKNTNFSFEEDVIVDIFIWRIRITGPSQTLCEGVNFVVQFEFSENWPFKPPKV
jgi:ubiquitin-protein ligase